MICRQADARKPDNMRTKSVRPMTTVMSRRKLCPYRLCDVICMTMAPHMPQVINTSRAAITQTYGQHNTQKRPWPINNNIWGGKERKKKRARKEETNGWTSQKRKERKEKIVKRVNEPRLLYAHIKIANV